MHKNEIIQQSKNAYNQWCEQWREQAKHHSKHEMKDLKDFQLSGFGKTVLVVANGASFEKNIDNIKEIQDKVEIFCCDKTLGHLIENGIRPQFCLLADANVSYETYMEKWKNELGDTVLFANVCGNPKWTNNGNWKDKYFFVNEDVIKSELEFSELSGCNNFIPAATNVSNAMVVFLTQCNNQGRRNFFGYDKILLIGFDYGWLANGNYYSFDHDANGKRFYMKHIMCHSLGGDYFYTSHNLHFSCRWLKRYIKTYDLPVVQCSKDSILDLPFVRALESSQWLEYKPEEKEEAKKFLKLRNEHLEIGNKAARKLNEMATDHWRHFAVST